MTTYPEITRRDGTLFFACPETSRAAIATSIERLIDLLDLLDDDPDLEPYLADTGWPQGAGVPTDDREADDADLEPSCGWVACEASYARYGAQQGNMEEECVNEDDEESDHSGFGDVEGMIEDMTGENSLGWTEHVDQDLAQMTHSLWGAEDGEPELGWCGHGAGYQEWEGLEEDDDDREDDHAERGIGDHDALNLTMNDEDWSGVLQWDGTGTAIAESLVRGLPTFDQRVSVLALIADGYQPGRSYI